jgi:hypothetical protein
VRHLFKGAADPSAPLTIPERVAMTTDVVTGGILNLMRQALVARSLGANVIMATESGRDTYGPRWGLEKLPFIRWSQRCADDVTIIPDIYTYLIPEVEGFVIAYQQNPILLRNDFDHARDRLQLWTDSPFLVEECRKTYPGKAARIVPNIIDNKAFPFVPQSRRRKGELIAFPRKGPEFIQSVYDAYRSEGGSYWQLEEINGLPFHEFAARLRSPQAFLASSDIEGCALPPLEAMAAGIAVLGKDARGGNFYMRDGETALVANEAAEAANALKLLERDELREELTLRAREVAQRWFPENEPSAFWRNLLAERPWA